MDELIIANKSDVTEIADAIREKGGTSETLSFPEGFKSAIANMSSGGGAELPAGNVNDVLGFDANGEAIPKELFVGGRAIYKLMGGTEGRTVISNENGTFYKVSDSTPSIEAFAAGVKIISPEGRVDGSSTPVTELADGVLLGFDNNFLVIPSAHASYEAGVYLPTTVQKLILNEGEQKIKRSLLPPQVQTDWNQSDDTAADFLKNRPFGEIAGGDTLTWDGNIDGLEHIDMEGEPFAVRISAAVPTKKDFLNGMIAEFSVDGEGVQTVDMTDEDSIAEIQGQFMEDGFFSFELFLIVPADNYDADDIIVPKAGIYVINPAFTGVCLTKLTLPGYTGFTTIKPLDTKFLPAHNHSWSDIAVRPTTVLDVVVSEYEDGTAKTIAKAVPHKGAVVSVEFDGVSYNCEVIQFINSVAVGNESLLGFSDNTGEPFFMTFNSNNEWNCQILVEDATVPHYVKVTAPIINRIPDAYISPMTTLWINFLETDVYLYHDSARTKKVTQLELIDIIENKPILIRNDSSSYYYPVRAYPAGRVSSGYIEFFDSSGLELIRRYTAEYTGS